VGIELLYMCLGRQLLDLDLDLCFAFNDRWLALLQCGCPGFLRGPCSWAAMSSLFTVENEHNSASRGLYKCGFWFCYESNLVVNGNDGSFSFLNHKKSLLSFYLTITNWDCLRCLEHCLLLLCISSFLQQLL
jgi:hypothetical protein